MEGFRPYEGAEPYLFVSCAHADSPAVDEIRHERRAVLFKALCRAGNAPGPRSGPAETEMILLPAA